MIENRIVENSLNEEKSFPVVLISFFHIWLFSEITSFQNSYSSKTSLDHLLLMEDKKNVASYRKCMEALSLFLYQWK